MKKIFVIVVLGVLFVLCIGNNNAMAERGKVVVIISDDFLNKKSKTEYFFQKKDLSLVLLEHIENSPPRPGQRAILLPNGKLRYPKNKAGITFNKVSGKINVLIALIQPLDEKDAPWEAEKAKEYFQSSKDFFEDSRQHSQVELSVEIIGWLKSQKTKSELTSSFESLSLSPSLVYDEAINLTDDFVNYNKVDCLFIVVAENSLNWTWNSAGATLGKSLHQTDDGGSNFSNVLIGSGYFSSSPSAISHELGHAVLSFYHGGGKNVSRKNECGYSSGKAEDYNDHFDVMGSYHFFFSALRQYSVGWLLEERVVTLSASASVELHPREIANSNGKQLIIIKINDNSFYTIELCVKKLESYDDTEFIGDGLLLRYHARDYGSWYDSVVFLQEDDNNEPFLRSGEEICGLGVKGEISIKYVSLEGKGEETRAKVEISFYCPEEIAPSVSVSSEATTLNAGQSLTAYVSVGNQMTVGCGTRTVNVEADLPAATWSAVFSPSTLEIAPTATSTTSVLVGIPESALPGFYNLTFRASDNETNLAGEAGLTVEVLCEADTMMVSPPSPLKLKKKTSEEATVTVTSADGCPVAGETVTAMVTSASGQKRITVSPLERETDENGEAVFTITTQKKLGYAAVSFRAGNLEKLLTVKVSKK